MPDPASVPQALWAAGLVQSFDDPRLATLRETVRRHVHDVVLPNGDRWEAEGTVPHEEYRRLGALGLLGLPHAVVHGGSAMGPIASVVFAEELSRSGYSGVPEAVLIHTDMSSTHIALRGDAIQQARYVPAMVRGESICSVAITEPDAGSDVAAIATRARRDGDGWVLDGVKSYITNALHGDVFVVVARTDPDAKASRAMSLFIVERGTPGLEVRAMAPKHGMLSSDIAELVFRGARLPGDALLGALHRGFYGVMDNLQNERLVIGAMCIGMAQQAIDVTLAHLRNRRAFGATLWDLQASRHRMAMAAARLHAARTLVHDTATRLARGADCVREVSMVKAIAGETLQDIVRDCLQLHGGAGYMHGNVVERIGRDARLMTIGGGATEVMLDEIAKRL